MADPTVSVTRADINFQDEEASAVSFSEAVLPTLFDVACKFDGDGKAKFVVVFASRLVGWMAASLGREATAELLDALAKSCRGLVENETGRAH